VNFDDVNDYLLIQDIIPVGDSQEILKKIKLRDKEWYQHQWYNPGEKVYHTEDEGEPLVMRANEDESNFLVPFIHKAIGAYVSRLPYDDDVRTAEFIHRTSCVRFNNYPLGARMAIHFDHIRDIFDGENKGVPILSIIGCLNSDYEGGELSFFGGKVLHKLTAGQICIFPSNFMYPHEVLPVTGGNRFTFVSWAF
jgi:hypothetical protein